MPIDGPTAAALEPQHPPYTWPLTCKTQHSTARLSSIWTSTVPRRVSTPAGLAPSAKLRGCTALGLPGTRVGARGAPVQAAGGGSGGAALSPRGRGRACGRGPRWPHPSAAGVQGDTGRKGLGEQTREGVGGNVAAEPSCCRQARLGSGAPWSQAPTTDRSQVTHDPHSAVPTIVLPTGSRGCRCLLGHAMLPTIHSLITMVPTHSIPWRRPPTLMHGSGS